MSAKGISRSGSLTQNGQLAAPWLFWSVLGVFWLSVGLYSIISWMTSDYFRPAPVGDTPIPSGQMTVLILIQIMLILCAVWVLWQWVIRPWRQQGELSWDGVMVLVFVCLYWQDPMVNYVNVSFWYNAHFFNMGSWASFIPGWRYPNHENFPEPVLAMPGFYMTFYLLPMLIGCRVLSAYKQRHPNAGLTGILALLFVVMVLIDLVVECFFMRMGAAAYPGTVHSLSVWAGQPYQFPIYEAVIIGAMFMATIYLRYYRDDKGRSFAERGIDNLKLPAAGKKFVTFLALSGFMQTYFIFGYFLPYNAFAIMAEGNPPYPSYLRAGICGEGTDYACPDIEHVPIPSRHGSLHIGPDDPRLPEHVRNNQDGPPYGFFTGE